MSNFSEFWPWVKTIKTQAHKRSMGTKAPQTDRDFSKLQIINRLQIAYLNSQHFRGLWDPDDTLPPLGGFIHIMNPVQAKPA